MILERCKNGRPNGLLTAHVRLSEGLPHGTSYPRAGGLPLRFCKFSSLTHTQGIEEHHLIGATVRVYSPAKTVADCFKFRHKIGLDVAVEALRDGWREKKFTLEQLAESARLCRVRRVIQPYLEMLT